MSCARLVFVLVLGAAVASGSPSRPDSVCFLIDTSPVFVPPPGHQMNPVAASDGMGSLVLWSDARDGETDIYAARVGHGGEVFDQGGIIVCSAAGNQRSPAVAYGSNGYLAAWSDRRTGDTSDVFAARLRPDGTVLDTAGIVVSSRPGFQGEPAVAFDGTNYLVVWTDERDSVAGIYASRVTLGGEVLDTAGIMVDTSESGLSSPAVAWNNANYLVVWSDMGSGLGDIVGARVTSGGTVLDTAGIAISSEPQWQSGPAVGFDGTNVLVVWHDTRLSAQTDLFGARVNADGEVLDPNGFIVCAGGEYQLSPAVAFDRTNFLVAWQTSTGHGDIFAARVTSNAEVLDPDGFLVRGGGENQLNAGAGFDGVNFLVVWDDSRVSASDRNVYGSRVSPGGEVLDPGSIEVSTAANSQSSPAAALGQGNFLVAWEDGRSTGQTSIYGARVARDGSVLDSAPVRFGVSPMQHNVSVAFDGVVYLAAWEQGMSRERDVYGARVNAQGELLDPAGFVITDATMEQCSPAAAGGSGISLVAWRDWRGASFYDIYAARVSSDGTVLDPDGIAICSIAGAQVSPAVAFDGSDFLVVWQDQQSSGRYVRGARVSSDGELLDPEGIDIAADSGYRGVPSAAYGAGKWLVVWDEYADNEFDVYGARVASDGEVLDPDGIGLCTAEAWQSVPKTVFDGSRFLVAWVDERNQDQDIYGARVTPEGVVDDSFAIVVQDGGQRSPALAGDETGTIMAFTGRTGTVQGRVYNCMRVWAALDAVTGVARHRTENVECRTPATTIIRRILSRGGRQEAELVDITGRRALVLRQGENDVSHLAPGIYFLRSAAGSGRPARSTVTKVVVQR
ncbi:MAG: T9SS type A sorting domain-containing protein [candidate division WOR-3 bacterium]|nr:MAG: T9SS type A sorting domain-containing protein [candidate division WOR-3 bacterium]